MNESEEIFRYRKCGFYGQNDCLCYDDGDRIFAFHATDANCEDMPTEAERFQCYNRFSYNVGEKCLGTSGDERERCLKSYFGSNYKFYTGPGGTFVNKKSVVVNGNRSYFVGGDNEGKFNFKTGFLDPISTTFSFRPSSRDAEIQGSLLIPDGDVELRSMEGGVYFGANTEYDDVLFEVDSLSPPDNMLGAGNQTGGTGSSCTNRCDFSHQRGCSQIYNSTLVCEMKLTGCLDWIFGEFCPYGCIGGACSNGLGVDCLDGDGDTYDNCVVNVNGGDEKILDCNDGDNSVYPGATEVCGNGIDEDCDGYDLRCPQDCGQDFIDPRDGQVYETVKISNMCWMAENLNIGIQLPTGGTNPNPSDDIIEKWCPAPDGTDKDVDNLQYSFNCDIYGGIYQWNEMMKGELNGDGQGICPDGWHISTESEWHTLEMYFANNDCFGNRIGLGCIPAGQDLIYGDFKALFAGYSYKGRFPKLNTYAMFWTSLRKGSSAWYRGVHVGRSEVLRASLNRNSYAMSVRCVKD